MDEAFPIAPVRLAFPSLTIDDRGRKRVYFDNPAGTQVPLSVAQAAFECLTRTNANLGGAFITSQLAGQIVTDAHAAMAEFLGASAHEEIVIGQSMTALTFHISRSIGKTIGPGDEVVVTRMDHDGNIAPWLSMAADCGATVRWVPFNERTWRIEPSALDAVLNKRTKLVALNAASNLTGSINDVAALVERAHSVGALAYVDGVQYSPHVPSDVKALGCDFFACSSYKFFGPHLGIVWGRKELLRSLHPYKVRPLGEELPERWEMGTSQIELLAALSAAVEYFAWLGSLAGASGDRRTRIRAAFDTTVRWEQMLAAQMIAGLKEIPGVRICGITDPADIEFRVPTISFTHPRHTPQAVAAALAERNIFVWSGHNYALEIVRELGIPEDEGVLRIGMVHYNTPHEVEHTIAALEEVLG